MPAKASSAAHALLDIANGTLLQEEAGERLRIHLELHWPALTCVQRLRGRGRRRGLGHVQEYRKVE